MLNKVYTVVWKKFARWQVRHKWRTAKHLVFVYSIIAAFNDLHSRFMQYRANVLYRLGLNYQVCHMEKALNDKYDVVDRRIVIVDAVEFSPTVLFRKSEGKKLVLFKKNEAQKKVFFTKGETTQYSVDFVVRVPLAVSFNMIELVGFVKTLHLPGEKFKVQIV
jgi:hypothetical protein